MYCHAQEGLIQYEYYRAGVQKTSVSEVLFTTEAMEGRGRGGEGLREKKPRRPETDDQKPMHSLLVRRGGGGDGGGRSGKS
jgi:hypothetical protein